MAQKVYLDSVQLPREPKSLKLRAEMCETCGHGSSRRCGNETSPLCDFRISDLIFLSQVQGQLCSGGHSGQMSPIESSASRTSATCSGERPGGES